MKKNELYDVDILDNGMSFEGIAKIDDMVIFVPDAVKGEKVTIQIIKANKSFAIGKIVKINKQSEHRVEPFCEVYKRCGGCNSQHIDYDKQLEIKNDNVKNVLRKQKVKYKEFHNIIGMGMPYYYRNKVQYPVRIGRDTKTRIGFYSKRSHDIVENNCCYIQNRVIDLLSKNLFEELVKLGFNAYNEENGTGDIRHLFIRRGYHTKEIMIGIVINSKELLNDNRFNELVKILTKGNENIKSIFLNLNTSDTNEILGDYSKKIYGDDYIYDYIDEYKYAISFKSFFQVNTIQTEVLYNVLKEGLDLKKEDILFDLYSGVGSIGIFLSNKVSKVYGIEIEKSAVEMANLNMKENNITNAEYIAGSVEDKIEEFKNRKIKPTVIVVDPPRKGLDEKSIEYILDFNAEKIGYVSCNPATLARDLKLLEEKYTVEKVTPVDMFPHTYHVETVVILKRK